MNRSAHLLTCLLAAAPAAAQEPVDWRMPFRSPQSNLVAPEAMYEHLRPMYEIARKASADARRFDENGVEMVDDPAWQSAYEKLLGLRQDPGYLSLVLRESMHVADRAIAIYGMFYVPEPRYVFQLIEHIPGEPSRTLREDGYRRAIEYLAIHIPARNPGDLEEWTEARVGPGGQLPPRPGDYSYSIDPIAFFALLDDELVEDPRDHVQAFWFLGRCVELRPTLAAPYMENLKEAVRRYLVDGERIERDAARTFVEICDPEQRPVPPGADPTELARYFDAVLLDLLPPIRHVSEGLVDLYPGTVRDELVAVGTAALRDGTLGEPAHGSTRDGAAFRGFRISRTPEPLDDLGLPVGTIVTAINGSLVATPVDVLRVLETRTGVERSLMVEFVDETLTLRAKEFRIR